MVFSVIWRSWRPSHQKAPITGSLSIGEAPASPGQTLTRSQVRMTQLAAPTPRTQDSAQSEPCPKWQCVSASGLDQSPRVALAHHGPGVGQALLMPPSPSRHVVRSADAVRARSEPDLAPRGEHVAVFVSPRLKRNPALHWLGRRVIGCLHIAQGNRLFGSYPRRSLIVRSSRPVFIPSTSSAPVRAA
jgi:hypothetical protein